MSTTIKYSMVKDKMDALKAQGLDETTIALVMAGMGIQVVKSDKDIEREVVNSLDCDKALDIMRWFANVPYKSKHSYLLGMYRRHWSKLPKETEVVTLKSGETMEVELPRKYVPTNEELLASWEILKQNKDKRDTAVTLYKDYSKDNAFALSGDARFAQSVALSNTRGGQV